MTIIKFLFLISLFFNNAISSNQINEVESHTKITKINYNPRKTTKQKSEIEILRKGLIIDNVYKPFIEDLKDKEKKKENLKNSFRKLTSSQEFKDIGFLNIPQEDFTKMTNTYRYILSHLKKYKSQFILYPYKFKYEKNSQQFPIENGGVFTLNQTDFPKENSNDFFNYIKEISSVNISRAKSLYDINIAILSLEYEIEEVKTNLFYESEQYCAYLVQKLDKVPYCLDSIEEFENFKKNYTTKGAVVLFNDIELLKSNSLYDESINVNKFDLLIIPDHVFGFDSVITEKFKEEGIEKIKKFIENGGNIIASGKSGYLLQKWNINSPVYNTEKYLTTIKEKYAVNIKGCTDSNNNSPDDDDGHFIKQILCLGVTENSFLSSSYLVTDNNGYDVLLTIDKNSEGLKYKKEGIEENLNGDENDFPFILTKKTEHNGRIWIVNGQALLSLDYSSVIMNILFYSMSKNIIFDYYFKLGEENEDLPIPGGEEGVQLISYFKFYNVFSTEITNLEVDILLPDKVIFLNKPSDCVINNNYPIEIPEMSSTNYLRCNIASLPQLSQKNVQFKIEITDGIVTQKKVFPLIYPIVSYKSSESDKTITMYPGGLLVKAELAAEIRATYNVDPSAMYPVPGKGWFTDHVLNLENKEATPAFDVNFISILPLISPVIDGSDEREVSKMAEVYNNYYDSHKYIFPFQVTGGDYDYIDSSEFKNKDVVIVSDWDTPVRISKVLKSSLNETETSKFNINKDYVEMNNDISGQDLLSKTNSHMLLKEIYFQESNLFYEIAYQRKLIFIDVAKSNGAKAQYNNNLDNCKRGKDPNREGCCKYEFGWSRNDIFFYKLGEVQNPVGMDETVLLTVDQYEKPTQNFGEKLGDAQSYIVKKGAFNSSLEDKLVPNEYSNVLLQTKSFTTIIDPVNQYEQLKVLSDDTIKLTHYLVPVIENDLKKANSIFEFELEAGDEVKGHNKIYQSLKFIDGFTIKLCLLPEQTRAGGKVIINLPEEYGFKGNDPIKNENIIISADNVAFYKTEYEQENNKIILYFKRGLLPNEAYGKPSLCEIYLEEIVKKSDNSYVRDTDFTMNLILEELKYDLNNKESNYEDYTIVDYQDKVITSEKNKVKATYGFFWSFPALCIETKMKRDEKGKINEYELLNPYSRIGIYLQELMKHRTIWAAAEAHHVSDPGLQTINPGLAQLSSIGISFIPFAEYVTHGSGLLIPGAVSTGRVEWTDIWGRRWIQPVRSLYPDIPPVPAPLMNFQMSTTFELLTPDGNERLLEWPSDEETVIRVQMKFLNNYVKYFVPIFCHKTQYPYQMENVHNFERETTYMNKYENGNLTPVEYVLAEENLGNEYQVNFGQSSVYGVCYQNEGSYLSGQKITSSISSDIAYAMTCADTNEPEIIKKCADELREKNMPELKRRKDKNETDESPNQTYNYSPDVENYYPRGYINEPSMWDLTKETYEDSPFLKGFPFHLDNNLPAIDVSPIQNPAYYKPHNFVAFPIFKGFGYKIEYDKNFGLSNKFGVYKGWWSDNLQNKDHTLLAGQETVNEVSVDKESLLKETDWISQRDLKNTIKNREIIEKRLKNIYVCLFNQNRVKVQPFQQKFAYPNNVYQNNVIPIIPDLDADDIRYTNYQCPENQIQYSPENISQIDNRIYTSTDKDWLYFSLNLRNEALETINVLMTLKPFSDRKYEGLTKVQEGGRFTYWNPPNGPNSFLVVDNVVNLIMAKRVDYELKSQIYPSSLNTFNIVSYQYNSIYDKEEDLREYTLKTYDNSYGFGDSTVLVYVGGTEDSSCKVNAGDSTYVKIVFYNNAGFDWNMKVDAIEFETSETERMISAYLLLKNQIKAVKIPRKYNFLILTIPNEIKNYIDIEPSDHNANVPPQFFDFQTINVVTIRDGFEGSYFYKITVHSDFPNKYKGRFWDIKVDIDESYFDKLPGYNDPTKQGYHDYKLKVPDIKFAVPYSEGEHKGKVYYTLGRGTNLKLKYKLMNNFKIDGIKLISEDDYAKLRTIDNDDDQSKKDETALNIWENVKSPKNGKLTYSISKYDNSYNYITIDFNEIIPELPYENEGLPDTTKIQILTKTSASQVEYGRQMIFSEPIVSYYDGRKNKENKNSFKGYSNVKGPWIILDSNFYIAVKNEKTGLYEESTDQEIYENDMGIIFINITAKNKGSSTSYDTDFILYVPKDITIDKEQLLKNSIKCEITEKEKENILTIKTKRSIGSQELYIQPLYLGFGNVTLLNQNNNHRLLSGKNPRRSFINKIQMSMCPTESCNTNNLVTQEIEFKVNTPIVEGKRGKVNLEIKKEGTFENPKYQLKAIMESNEENVNYIFYRKINDNSDWEKISEKDIKNTLEDSPLNNEETKSLDKYIIYYRVETYSDSDRIIAGDALLIEEIKDINETKEKNNSLLNKKPIIIILSVIGGLILIASVAWIILLIMKKKYENKMKKSAFTSNVQNYKKKYNEIKNGENSSSREMRDSNDLKISKYVGNPNDL